MLHFRTTCMGTSYGVVRPYMPISPVLARKRLFAEYRLDWNLGSPPIAAPNRGRAGRRGRAARGKRA
jgi:hypothetical protein